MEEQDIFRNEKIEIIENQLWIIQSLIDTDNTIYDEFVEDKIKTISKAIRVIQKCQDKIYKDL